MLNVSARAINTCRGPEAVSSEKINEIKKISPLAAKQLHRLNAAVGTMKRGCKSGKKMGIRLGRKAITRRMRQLSEMTLRQKGSFLKTRNYLSLSCDESDTFSATAPLAAALQPGVFT